MSAWLKSVQALAAPDFIVRHEIGMMEKEQILAEIRKTAINGTPLGRQRFEAETGIKGFDWSGRYWTRWSDAVRKAGYEPNVMQGPIPEEKLLHSLVSIIRELGRFPPTADLKLKSRNSPDFPSHNTFNRLGRKASRARRVVDYCEAQDGLEDIADIARPFAASLSPDDKDPTPPQFDNYGYVYLMKSGKYYKIGRSISAEKRTYEIQLQLPEELKLVHEIKTDDPVGIEAYWHKRFSNKRVRGEWFSLTSQDVKTFRRRKFL